eukprot:jgi/Undpi1/3486/HiC_scaffold_16.g06858.m1
MDAAAASGDQLSIIPLLPRAFEFIFAQIEEIKRDVANAHIRLIAPYLARHGADYERAKFEVRLKSGAASLDRTKTWISSAVSNFLGNVPADGGTVDAGERRSRAKGLLDGHEEFHRSVLTEAFIGLLRSTVRLDRIEEGPLPETLFVDGTRLAATRDDVDRVTLVATLCVLTRQGGVLVWGEGGGKGGGVGGIGLPAGEAEGLRSLLMNSAQSSNEVFRLFFGRVIAVLKGMVAGGDVMTVCQLNGLQEFVGELGPVGARLQHLFSHNLKVFRRGGRE